METESMGLRSLLNTLKKNKYYKDQNMKWSPILHGIAAVSGIVGFLSLVFWWIVLFAEGASPLSAEHLYNDAIALLLLSIAFGVGALVHQGQEGNKK